ncbi:MAG TPA: carbamoyltransferase [Thermoanaerobaculia bacterium]|nr:carbamoyltransferase [Thermoanaerobaculia bacterium]
MALNILGISAHYHDAACCLLRDGELIAAAEEERFSRVKHDARLPWQAFRFCLEQGGITLADVDCVAYYENPEKKLSRQIWMALHPESSPTLRQKVLSLLPDRVGRVERQIRHMLGYTGRLETFDHHHSHAASSFFYSGFEEAAVLTVDGVGEWATTTFGRAAGSVIDLFEEVHFPSSLGLLYSTLTSYLGFDVNDGEYKVMGLAPYGAPRYVEQVRALVTRREGGQYRLNLEYFDFLQRDQMYSDRLIELFGAPPRMPESELLAFHQDVARSVQQVLEEILLDEVIYLHSRVPSRNLCMAGGVALNCVANSCILRDGPFAELFVQPAASDAGGCLGAAALAHVRLTGERPAQGRLTHMYWGPATPVDDIAGLLAGTSRHALDHRGRLEGLLEATVDRLAAGKVVGWFQGRMEFGPRALGARSILADPRHEGMRDRINALVKMRESFRPFAPAVLARQAGEHFAIDHASPFMLETCPVSSPFDLPAITHVDRSARLQTVDPESSPRFAALLARFADRTGCPVLLNTSFNMRGEPIVCTPEDALLCFARSGIDALVLEDFIIDRESVPPAWWNEMVRRSRPAAAAGVGHKVYTLL